MSPTAVTDQNRRVVLYFTPARSADRWFKNDHRWRAHVRRLIRGPDEIGGVERVFLNLVAGLHELQIQPLINPALKLLRQTDLIGIFGVGTNRIPDYRGPTKLVTAISVVAHPSEYPDLFRHHPIAFNLVHCEWSRKIFAAHYGTEKVREWAVGIDTELWQPSLSTQKKYDFLVYDKVRWDRQRVLEALVEPLLKKLQSKHLSYKVITYGKYKPKEYHEALQQSRYLLFLSEHETQGLAYQEAMACGLPVLAWDQGLFLDPWRYRYGESLIEATSVPFFGPECGVCFKTLLDFPAALDEFLQLDANVKFSPRRYVEENLGLAHCARNFIGLLLEAAAQS